MYRWKIYRTDERLAYHRVSPRILTPHPASKLGLLLRHCLLWNLRLSSALAGRYELMICRCAVLAQPSSNGGTASHGLDRSLYSLIMYPFFADNSSIYLTYSTNRAPSHLTVEFILPAT